MDRLKDMSLAYFREEVRQYEMMLKGDLDYEYRVYLNRKIKIFKYVIKLIDNGRGDCV